MASATVNTIATAALAGPPEITASHVYKFTRSPFAIWCDRFAPPDERDALDDFTRMLFEQGHEHEQRILRASFAHASQITYETEREGFQATLEAMQQGVAQIQGAPLFWLPEGLYGRADILERDNSAPSVFGSYHYVVKEIKLAKNIRAHHALQAAFYHRIISNIQGYTAPTFVVVDRDAQEHSFAYDAPELEATLAGIRAIRDGRITPDAVYDEGIWPWASYTNALAEERRDASLIGGVGPATRGKLIAAGFGTVERLAEAEIDALMSIRGIGDRTAFKLRTNARAIRGGSHIPLARVAFPSPKMEIFLDLEGTGAQTSADGIVEMDYLIGALVRDASGERYHGFVAKGIEGEGDMFRAFVDWLAEQRDFVLYHWHHYEVTHLKKLAERHGIAPDRHAHVFGSMRDLYKDATSAFAWPTYSSSIKKIAPYCGFSWREKSLNGMASIALYYQHLRTGDAATLQRVLDYNEDDCRAMRAVKDWIVAHADSFDVPTRSTSL